MQKITTRISDITLIGYANNEKLEIEDTTDKVYCDWYFELDIKKDRIRGLSVFVMNVYGIINPYTNDLIDISDLEDFDLASFREGDEVIDLMPQSICIDFNKKIIEVYF